MSEEEIVETIQAFGKATRRAIESGFDGIELHGANTYLIQQFSLRIRIDERINGAVAWKIVIVLLKNY